jgi:hypothetical protein
MLRPATHMPVSPAVRWFDAGQFAEGVIAIGQGARGVIAIGQGASGVIAVGQLSRGFIAVGQLALGVLAFGQLAVGLVWAGGMVSVSALRGPSLLGLGALGSWSWRDLRRLRFRAIERRAARPKPWQIVVLLALAALVWFVGLQPVIHDLVKTDGILDPEPEPRVLR